MFATLLSKVFTTKFLVQLVLEIAEQVAAKTDNTLDDKGVEAVKDILAGVKFG